MKETIIYERTSTKEQHPELQHKDNVEFCKEKGLEIVETKAEQGSAWKNKKREIWDYVVEKAKKEKLNIVLWRYDRAFRNRKEFFKFMKIMFEVYDVKIYSVKEPSILTFWNMIEKSYTDNPVINELIKGIFMALWDFLIQQAGEQAEEESTKKSERVKLAVRREEGITKSYKGNKWGRKSLSNQTKNKIIKLREQGKSYNEICKLVTYSDKNNNPKNVSKGIVHKILHEKLREIPKLIR